MPRTVPCGTPERTDASVDSWPITKEVGYPFKSTTSDSIMVQFE